MDNKIYNWKELKALISSQGYKHVRLTDLNGKKLVNYNAINKKAKGLADKLREIETRMKVLQPGIYILDAQTMYGNTSPAMSHYLGVGNYDPRELDGNTRQPVQQQQPISEREPRRNRTEHAVSFDTALDNVKTIAQLEAKVARLEDQIEAQKTTIRELEAELDDPETMSDESEEIPGWLAGFMPVAEKLIDLSERKQRFNETKLLLDQGYDLTDIFGKKSRGSDRGRSSRSERRSARANGKEIPRPGTRNWNRFVEHIDGLPDEEFETALNQLEENDPDVYEALCEELDVTYEEAEEQEEEEEQEEQ